MDVGIDPTGDDELAPQLDHFGFRIDPIGHEVIQLAGKVHRRAMRQMPAMRKIHA